MTESLIKFVKKFERFKSGLSQAESRFSKLSNAIEFWNYIAQTVGDDLFELYISEYKSLLLPLLDYENVKNIQIDELILLTEIGDKLNLELRAKQVAILVLAEKYFYAGAIKRGLLIVDKLFPKASEIEVPDDTYFSEFDRFGQVCESARDISEELYKFLFPIYLKWEAVRESTEADRINCLFVANNGGQKNKRGVMRKLSGTVELQKVNAKADEIAFDEVSARPDDPFVGASYDALIAIRKVFSSSRFDDRGKRMFHAHFSIENSSERFEGDSIGLGTAVYSYVELLKTEVTRKDKYIASEVAFTGSIDDNGNILPINKNTLACKIECAFFSPIKYLVLPESHRQQAVEILNQFSVKYPNRKLQLIFTAHLTDLVENHNIIRSEKVCYGDYFVKKSRRLIHNRAIQSAAIIVLTLLTYAIICQIEPKAWFGFSYKIDRIEVMGNKFKTINPDGHTIWVSEEFEGDLNKKSYEKDRISNYMWSVNIDDDSRDELIIVPDVRSLPGCLNCYDDDGELLWSKPSFVETTFPGDKEYFNYKKRLFYEPPEIIPYIDSNGNKYIITGSCVSSPARNQYLLFDTEGNIVSGPYIQSGTMLFRNYIRDDINNDGEDEIFLHGMNNSLRKASLAVFNPKTMNGVSPPYENKAFQLSGMIKGTQLYYIAFPETPLSYGDTNRNGVRSVTLDTLDNSIHVIVFEGTGIDLLPRNPFEKILKPPKIHYILDNNFIPISVYFDDNDFVYMNSLLAKLNWPFLSDEFELCDSLKRNVIVYEGDSLIYGPAQK